MSRSALLQQHLYDLRERERLAKLHNRELLQQFEEAQKTLTEMLDRTSAMKMIRKEYESYFWRCSQQDYRLHLKPQTTQNMPGGSQLCQKTSEKSSKSTPLSQAPEKMPGSTEAYQEVPFLPGLQPCRQTLAQTQTAVFPKKASQQLWNFTQSSQLFPHSYLIGSQVIPFTQTPQPYAPLEKSPFTNHPSPSTLNPSLSESNTSDQHNTHHSSHSSLKKTVSKRPPSSTNGETSCSEDLDVKPVRLSSREERENSQSSSQKKEKELPKTDRKNSDESQQSSHKSSLLKAHATSLKERAPTSESGNSETSKYSGSSFKETKNTLIDDLSDNDETESEDSDSIKMSESEEELRGGDYNGAPKSTEKPAETKQIISEPSTLGDEDTENENGKETKLESEEYNADIPRCSSEEEDQETDESADEKENTSSGSGCEVAEDNIEEPKSDRHNGPKNTAQENSDSEDCIVSPQTRCKTIYVIPELPSEHESSRKTAFSDDDQESSGLSDIEHVLAPQQKHTERQQPNLEENNTVARVFVEKDQKDHHSDSKESDDFYDF